MDQQTLELALLAGNSYRSTREANVGNRIPVPNGWTVLDSRTTQSGFEAVAYGKDGQIVIAYAGTYFSDERNLRADAILGLGFNDAQLLDAAVFYEDVKRGSNERYEGSTAVMRFTGVAGASTHVAWLEGNTTYIDLSGDIIDGGAGNDYIDAGTGAGTIQRPLQQNDRAMRFPI